MQKVHVGNKLLYLQVVLYRTAVTLMIHMLHFQTFFYYCSCTGVLHDDLKLFLDTNLSERSGKFTLGVGDSKIGAAIQEELGISCQASGVAAEIIRGE